MSRADSRIKACRQVAAMLDGMGKPKEAEDVRALCRSYAMLKATASSVHKELEETRRAAGMPTWERKDG